MNHCRAKPSGRDSFHSPLNSRFAMQEAAGTSSCAGGVSPPSARMLHSPDKRGFLIGQHHNADPQNVKESSGEKARVAGLARETTGVGRIALRSHRKGGHRVGVPLTLLRTRPGHAGHHLYHNSADAASPKATTYSGLSCIETRADGQWRARAGQADQVSGSHAPRR